ncbi:permease [Bradyrhizobium sp. USDA 4454]
MQRMTRTVDLKLGTITLIVSLATWGLAVAATAYAGLFQTMTPIYYGPLVAVGIVTPFAIYALTPAVRRYFENVGVYPLTVLHTWRIPASLLFFWYGFQNQLPPAFWILAGVGDFLAGAKALPLLKGPANDDTYFRIHRFGFADFVVAVGTGLLFTVLNDPRMVTIRELPMVLIPLYGVGISGASHLIAFDLLRRRRNAAAQDQAVRIHAAE